MNFKKISIALVTMLMIACADDTTETFDHAAQYTTEKVAIESYLSSHYLNLDDNNDTPADATDDVYTILAIPEGGSQTPLNDANSPFALESATAVLNEVTYTYYYIITNAGDATQDVEADDTINVNYILRNTSGSVIEENDNNDSRFTITSGIMGWQEGIPNFNGGVPDESDATKARTYTNTGKGFLIIPSGLGYQNLGSGAVSGNTTLIFYINLKGVAE
ncbi:FKBP-type peptidyl-prolyl cis-trans isomerase [Flavobacteriaceae bacterium]|nr:FKBP-type peptidyl-prolyl cis-trans isomerase [Flavobacteriaceae bacterium]